jgi:anti-anti-sigma factor
MSKSQFDFPMSFGVRLRRDGDRVVIAIHGDLDLATVGQLHAAVDEALSEAGRLELDLRHTRFMDSTGITAIVAIHQRLGQLQEAVVLRDPNPRVRRVLALSGIDQLVQFG